MSGLGTLVQGWVDGTWTNNGMLIKENLEISSIQNNFRSSDHATADHRPRLEVFYTVEFATIESLSFSSITHKSATAAWDTTLRGEVSFDSFAIFFASDSITRYSAFTADTTIALNDTLTSNIQYNFIVVGYNADTARVYSNSVSFTTDSLPFPYNFKIVTNVPGQTIVSVVDSSGSKNLKMVFYDTLGILSNDTISYDGVNPNTILDTVDTSNFPDSLVAFKILLLNSQGDSVMLDSVRQLYLHVAFPLAVIASDTSDTTIQIYFDSADINPDRVFYQLYDSAQGVYVNTSGDTSGTDTTWHIKTAFDTLTINVGINTEHWFFLKGRNSDSVATTYSLSDSLWSWAQIVDVVSAFAYNKDSVLIKLDPKLNPSYTFFALEDSVTGRFIDFAANRLRSTNVTVDSSWAWATYSEWGASAGYYLIATPNTTYVFRAYAKEGIRR